MLKKKPNFPEVTYGKLLQQYYFKFIYGEVEMKCTAQTIASLWALEHLGLKAYYGDYIGCN